MPAMKGVLNKIVLTLVIGASMGFWGCGGGKTTPFPWQSTVPEFSHVILLVEENQAYATIIGNPAMPYLNSLAEKYGLATNYFANAHPSISDYFMLTTGDLVTNDDGFSGTVTSDNIVRELLKAGRTWKSYAETLPSVGYTGGSQYPYVKHHNPFAYFSDVVENDTQRSNLVPFSQFAQDLAAGQLPNYSFIVPDQYHNMHDCPEGMSTCTNVDKLAAADAWLVTNIGPLVDSSTFQEDSLLLIVFDESEMEDLANGGGHVALLVISHKAKHGTKSTTFYQHQSTLRLTVDALRLNGFPGASATASSPGEFFTPQ